MKPLLINSFLDWKQGIFFLLAIMSNFELGLFHTFKAVLILEKNICELPKPVDTNQTWSKKNKHHNLYSSPVPVNYFL